MSSLSQETFPRPVLIGVAALLGLTMVGTATVRIQHLAGPTPIERAGPAAQSVGLRFEDAPNGVVNVKDGQGHFIKALKPGEDAFIRVVMRGLARERIERKIGPEQPFILALGRDGRLSLQDPATGRLIDLESFGRPERQYFADLMIKKGQGS